MFLRSPGVLRVQTSPLEAFTFYCRLSKIPAGLVTPRLQVPHARPFLTYHGLRTARLPLARYRSRAIHERCGSQHPFLLPNFGKSDLLGVLLFLPLRSPGSSAPFCAAPKWFPPFPRLSFFATFLAPFVILSFVVFPSTFFPVYWFESGAVCAAPLPC